MNKSHKSLIALLLVLCVGLVGLTIAYFANSTSIINEFETSEYGTDVIETFTSPAGWQPGDETPKVLTVKNTGEVDEAVRIKVEEKWVNKNGQELSLTQDGNVAAQIHYINDSDWTRVDVSNGDYYYYYYNYKLAPDEETSELLDKVTFNPLINASTTCTTTTENGVTTRSCKSNGNGYDGATYTIKFTVETVQYNKYTEAWSTEFAIAEEKPHPGTLTLLEKTNTDSITNYSDGNIHEMYVFEHQTPASIDYRYIGNDPYNYVYFNCDSLDNQNSETCEIWRILGVFDVDDGNGNVEQRMKLVRGRAIPNNMIMNSTYTTDWTVLSLNGFLNSTYYNRVGAALTYGLKQSGQDLIDDAIYYLGAVSFDSESGFGSTEKLYSDERGNVSCGSCNNESNKLLTSGKVGLMYPSDEFMVYGKGINLNCYNNPGYCSGADSFEGWIAISNIREGQTNAESMWLISSYAESLYYMLSLYDSCSLSYGDLVENSMGVRAVVYLKSTVKIIDGDG